MKKKLFILVFITFILSIFMPGLSSMRAESPTTTNELPSNVFLQKEKRSLGADYGQSMLTTKHSISAYTETDDAVVWASSPGSGWQSGAQGSVPVGDATLPIIFSLLVLYLGYRRVTTSRRKNDL